MYVYKRSFPMRNILNFVLTRYALVSKCGERLILNQVCTPSPISGSEIWRIQVQLSTPYAWYFFHPNFMAIGPIVTKPSADWCWPLCKLISNSMHVNLGQAITCARLSKLTRASASGLGRFLCEIFEFRQQQQWLNLQERRVDFRLCIWNHPKIINDINFSILQEKHIFRELSW